MLSQFNRLRDLTINFYKRFENNEFVDLRLKDQNTRKEIYLKDIFQNEIKD